jgi:hypothetical protein
MFRSVLDSTERISEILFGVIMVLTFTGAIGVATADRLEVREMLVGAVGCNFVWGLIDAGMFVMARLAERGRNIRTFRVVRSSTDEAARHAVADALPPLLVSALPPESLDNMKQALRAIPEPPQPRLTKDDIVGAFLVFLLVFLSTLPIALPFTFIADPRLALRVSNGIAVVMLFLCGVTFGRAASFHPWASGIAMVIIGVALVGLTMALGG